MSLLPVRTTITATFPNGSWASRTTRARYLWAAMAPARNVAGASSTITFHRTEAEAREFATKRGQVVRTDLEADRA